MVEEPENSKQTLVQSIEDGLPKGYNPQQVEEGVKALFQSLKKLSSGKKSLFEDDGEFIRILVTCVKIPITRNKNYRFILPHGYLKDTSEVCLFVRDRLGKKSREYEDDVRYFKNLLSEAGVKSISEVISINQYKQEYNAPEMRRRLAARFDCILADAVVNDWLHGCLGKQFHRCRKLPTPVRLKSKDLKSTIDRVLHKTLMTISGNGSSFSAKVANTKQSVQQICENIEAFVKGLQKNFPGKWGNIKSLYIFTDRSLTIPIYVSLVMPNHIKVPRVEPGSRGKKVPKVSGDISTLPNGYQVLVLPDGTVKVKGKKANGKVDWLTEKEIKKLCWEDIKMSDEEDNAEENEEDDENFISGSEEEGDEEDLIFSSEEEGEENLATVKNEEELSDSDEEAEVEAAEEAYLKELSMEKEEKGNKRKKSEEDPVSSAKKLRKTSKVKKSPVSKQWQVSDIDESNSNKDIKEESENKEKKSDMGDVKKVKNKKKNTPKSSITVEEESSDVKINKGKKRKNSIKKETSAGDVGDSKNEVCMVNKRGSVDSSVSKKIKNLKGKNEEVFDKNKSDKIDKNIKGKLRKNGKKLSSGLINRGLKGNKKGK